MVPWGSGYIYSQIHSTKPKLGFCTGSNPASGVTETHDGENL